MREAHWRGPSSSESQGSVENFHRCRRLVDVFLIDRSISHSRYRHRLSIHMRSISTSTVDSPKWKYGRYKFRPWIHLRENTVHIHDWYDLYSKRISWYRPSMWLAPKTNWSTVNIDRRFDTDSSTESRLTVTWSPILHNTHWQIQMIDSDAHFCSPCTVTYFKRSSQNKIQEWKKHTTTETTMVT